MYQVIAYLKFFFKSTNQHAVHSPFVFNLVTKCFYDKTLYEEYSIIKHYRKTLLNSKDHLNIIDLGQGSKKMGGHKRSIASMARTSGSSFKDAKLLFRLSNYFKFNDSLELGTSLGIATHSIALGNKNSTITTIEGCSNTSEYTKQLFKKNKIENTKFLNGSFIKVIPSLKQNNFDFIFFDGHHNKVATLNYFERLITKAHNNTIFVLDDIYWSKGMTEAWELIIADQRVSVSIDTFNLGFVFFRKEQPKQHFRIRV